MDQNTLDTINRSIDSILEGVRDGDTHGAILRFFVIWMGLNQFYKHYSGSTELEQFKTAFSLSAAALSDEERKDLLVRFKSTTIPSRQGVVNLKTKAFIELPGTPIKGAFLSYEDFFATRLLTILYTIRCNLFHGDKFYDIEKDTPLLEWAVNTLNRLRFSDSFSWPAWTHPDPKVAVWGQKIYDAIDWESLQELWGEIPPEVQAVLEDYKNERSDKLIMMDVDAHHGNPANSTDVSPCYDDNDYESIQDAYLDDYNVELRED